jgi:hypothetical protein
VPAALKDEVKKLWKNFYVAGEYTCLGRELKAVWKCTDNQLTLDSTVVKKVPAGFLGRYCNKSTAIYCLPPAQKSESLDIVVFGCIFKKWFRFHNERPNIDHFSFIGTPIRVTATGPTKIVDILSAHQSVCETLASLTELKREEAAGAHGGSKHSQPWGFQIPPLFRAIIMVFDAAVPCTVRYVDIDRELLRRNVLLVRTGEESGLSGPISFKSLESVALPLERDDVTLDDGIDIVRVSLDAGVGFIAELERREDARTHARDRCVAELAQMAEEEADDIMRQAEIDGIKKTPMMEYFLNQALAARRGEVLEDHFDYPFHSTWR